MPRKSWWARLPFGVRMAAGTSALLIVVGAGAAGVAALTRHDDKPRIVTAMGQEAAAPPAGPVPEQIPPRRPYGRPQLAAPRAAPPAPRTARKPHEARPAAPTVTIAPQAPPSAPAQPVRTTRTEIETRQIPFETQMVRDPKMARGTKRIETPGVPGEETLRYLVTLTNGQPTERKLIDATVTKQPQHRVVAVGSKRGCGDTLNFCVPLGRSQFCPADANDEDAELLDPDDLAAEWGRLGGCR